MNIAFVPVRCGSKAIKWKNIKYFCGKPLVYWCLQALEDCIEIDEVFVATDCNEIADVALELDLKKVKIYRRDAENATENAGTEAVMLEFLSKQRLESEDRFVLVQATNPFVTERDFTAGLESVQKEKFDSLLTCCRIKRFFWEESGVPKNYDYKNRPLRQEFKGELVENGAFYINSVGNILRDKNRLSGKIGIHEMPEHSFTELDENEDWIIAEQIFQKHNTVIPIKKKIKMLLTDVDGVLTDSGMYYTESGDEMKKFSTYDGVAFGLLKSSGIKTGMITGEARKLNLKRAKKLKMDYVYQGVKDKLSVLLEICRKESISPEEVAFVGDDINDLDILKRVGMAACPSSAMPSIKAIEGIIVLKSKGGEGVIRELVDKYVKF
jgi:YrbI family 3-deoxy-D-manno-octulosonate 8-phosphate phosphatase